MFDEFTDDELVMIFTIDKKQNNIKEIYSKVSHDTEITNLREHAFGTYWKRKIEKRETFSRSTIDAILEYKRFSVTYGILGDAARFGLMEAQLCEYTIKYIPVEEWAHSQLQAKIELTRPQRDDVELSRTFIQKKTIWALAEVIQEASLENVQVIEQMVLKTKSLGRRNNNFILELIKNRQKVLLS